LQALVNITMNLQIPKSCGTSWLAEWLKASQGPYSIELVITGINVNA
jgi:hypothetical protein